MTREELLLVHVVEECQEVAQRATKTLRFGADEVQPGQDLNNVERLRLELADLWAVVGMLETELGVTLAPTDPAVLEAKRAKVEHFLTYSNALGRYTP